MGLGVLSTLLHLETFFSVSFRVWTSMTYFTASFTVWASEFRLARVEASRFGLPRVHDLGIRV